MSLLQPLTACLKHFLIVCRSENSLYPRDISFVKEYYKRVLESQPKIVADIISNIG